MHLTQLQHSQTAIRHLCRSFPCGAKQVYARNDAKGETQWRRSFLVKIEQFALRADA